MVLEGNNLPSTLLVSFTKSNSHRFNISPSLHSSKSLGTGLPCFSHQSHQDWKLRMAQIVLSSVLFCTNPLDIVFNSKSDVNLFTNLLVTSLIAFLFFVAETSSLNHLAIPLSSNKYGSFSIYSRDQNFLHAPHNPLTNRQKTRDVIFEKIVTSHMKSVSGETLPATIYYNSRCTLCEAMKTVYISNCSQKY